MTTRTTFLGGTDWSDGEVLYAADLNDSIEGTQLMYSDNTQQSWTDQTSFVSAATVNISDFGNNHAIRLNTFVNDTTAINLEIKVLAVVNGSTYTLITKTGIVSTTADYEVFIRRLSDADTVSLAITEKLITETLGAGPYLRATTGSVSTDNWEDLTQLIVQVKNATTGGTITHRNTKVIHYRN